VRNKQISSSFLLLHIKSSQVSEQFAPLRCWFLQLIVCFLRWRRNNPSSGFTIRKCFTSR